MNAIHVLITLLIVLYNSICASLNLPGQCPILIPSEVTTTSSIFLSETRRPGLQVIAHRGSSFSLPEHTIAAYRLALELGADYIEPDIVSTKDGTLVAVHSLDLNFTTNVADIYPGRNGTLVLNGVESTGYFVYDFTFEEIKTLRVRQRLPEERRSQQFDYLFSIPTLRDIFDLLHEWNTELAPLQNSTKKSGVYIELKKPEILQQFGIDTVELLMSELQTFPHSNSLFFGNSLADNESKEYYDNDNESNKYKYSQTTFGCEHSNSYSVPTLVIQCYHEPTIRRTAEAFKSNSLPNPPFIYLVDKHCHDELFWYNVGELESIVTGVGPNKACLVGESGYEFMIQAKKHNVAVHAWTTREEVDFLISSDFATAEEELRYLYCHVGINGIFTENVDLGVRVGVRGCDDFKSPIDLWYQYREYEKETGMDETIRLKDCSEDEEDSILDFSSGMLGFAVGMVLSFCVIQMKVKEQQICKERKKEQHQQISQNDDNEII